MKVLKRDRKNQSYRLLVESEDDLWHLFHLIENDDVVTALTERRDQGADDKLRPSRDGKKKMRLGILVSSLEFHDFAERLRVLGVIQEGPQDHGSHHTLNIEDNSTLTIEKPIWKQSHLQLLENALQSTSSSSLLFVSLDMDEALVAVARYYGIEEIATIRSQRSGKQFQGKGGRERFFQEIVSVSSQLPDDVPILLIGPGFTKENLHRYLKEKVPGLFGRCAVFASGQSGMAGINEVLKKGTAAKFTQAARVQFELSRVEDFLSELGKDSGMVSYGLDRVKSAAAQGAIEELLVCDEVLTQMKKGVKENGKPGSQVLDTLMETVESQAGSIHIISRTHDGGRQLMSFGGVVAFLRYRMDD